MNYLGATIGGSPKKKVFWKPLARKIKTKLNAWRCSIISKAGRLVLIKAILNAIPTYWMGIHKVPVGITKEIELQERKFLWGEISPNNTHRRKLHTIRWEIITRPKNKGGLRHSSTGTFSKMVVEGENRKGKIVAQVTH